MKIDLHIHTKYSDGGSDIDELFDKLSNENVKVVSITDHDNIDAYSRLEKIDRHGIEVIPGMEVDVMFSSKVFHILLYGFDKNSECIRSYLKKSRESDIACFERMISDF